MIAGVCNLYTNKSTVQEMAKLFGTPATYRFNAPADVYPQYPGIVVREDQGQRILQQMTWGFPRHSTNKRTGKPNKPTATNNARDDKLWTIWRQWFTDPAQRCLIPFTSFAEAEGEPGKMTRNLDPRRRPATCGLGGTVAPDRRMGRRLYRCDGRCHEGALGHPRPDAGHPARRGP